MLRLLFFSAICFSLIQACNPPVRLKPGNVKTGLDSTFYAGVVEDAKSVDLREARFLAKIKVGDLGVSLDCKYPDVLDYATAEVRRIGGNLLVITEHTRFEKKSRCHRIKGDIYQIGSLEGLESQIHWNPARPLLAGDLRGEIPSRYSEALPPIHTEISCRIGGDYFKEAILRTETIFWTDSTFLSGDANKQAFLLWRAQLHFDLAELHARRLKARLIELGPNVSDITGQYRDMTLMTKKELRTAAEMLDAELAGGQSDAMEWVPAELWALDSLAGDWVVDLRRKKRR